MKKQTFEMLYKSALEKAERKRSDYDYEEVEVVLVPVVLCKRNGKVQSITGVDTGIILEEENKFPTIKKQK